MNTMNPLSNMPGFDAMQAQQEAFMKAMTGGWAGATPKPEPEPEKTHEAENSEDLDAIKKQLADLQDKLSKLK
jgi:polyhydroxyalkanoate synthesis regulator protein